MRLIARSRGVARLDRVRGLWPGLAVSGLIAIAASSVSAHYGGPLLLYALLFGLAFHFLYTDPRCRQGLDFASRALLRTGVALLGARITFSQIADLGVAVPLVALLGVVTTIGIGALLARRFGLSGRFGILTGGAVSICGASAALAIGAVMPRGKEADQQVLLTVVGVTALSTFAMATYPMLVKLAAFDDTAAGVFLGGTIHDVAQVVAAGLIVSPHAGEVATVVKLLRVALLVPTVLVIGVMYGRGPAAADRAAPRPPFLPWFMVAFVALVLLGSVGGIPTEAASMASTASKLCLVVAIGALGVRTSLQDLATLGWRPIALLVAETAWLAALFFAFIMLWERFAV